MLKSLTHLLATLLSLSCCLFNTAHGADIHISNAPNWAEPLPVPAKIEYPKADVQNGIHYVLLDVQVRAVPQQPTAVFQHYVEHVINQNGVEENSQINLSYDPVYQTLQLHTLVIHRNGQRIDKTGSAAMKILQREDEMNNLIYNGEHTLNIILDDVRVGDTIEYSFTREGANPVYQGLFGYEHYLNWSVPVGELNLRVLWGKPKPLYHRQINANVPVTERNTRFGKEYRVHLHNLQPLSRESNTPDWYEPWGSIQFSELDQWSQVNQWGLGLYKDAWQSNAELDAIVADIRNRYDSDEARISQALHFVQSEIRYLGIELGENSHIPTPAADTLQRRYGDCKDKTVLLIAILNKLGIEAHPALVNTDLTHTLTDYLPSTRHFDHVITYVEHNDQVWWLDPTRTYQHGLISRIHQPDFGLALVLKPGTDALLPMNPNNQAYGVDVLDRFIIQSDVSKPVVYTTSTVYEGWNAENQRDSLGRSGEAQLQKQYLEFFQYYYPGIATRKELVVKDDDRDNRFAITEYYEIADFWTDKPEKQRHVTTFYANAVTSHLDVPDEPKRAHPLYLSHPYRIQQTIELILPNDDWLFENETFTEDNPFFQFQYAVEFNESARKLKLTFGYLTHTDHIPAEQYPVYVKGLENVQDYLSYGIYQSYDDASTSSAPADSTDEASDWLEYVTPTNVIFAFLGGYFVVFLLWRLDQWRKPFDGEANFFPVTLPKFLFMWVFSLGTYPMYWFYRNYRYVKEQQDRPMMPVARGIFYWVWYFNLWRYLKDDNEARHDQPHLPPQAVAIALAVVFFICTWAVRNSMFWMAGLAVSAALCLPLANYILYINREHPEAVRHFSRWLPRHALLLLLSTPLLLLSAGQEIGALPHSEVINGDRLWQRDLKQLQRNGITKPGDDILFFYSDGFLSVMEDGNGLTERHVFSYWEEEDGQLSSISATFAEIDDIEVTRGKTTWENTIVNVLLKNGDDFVLYLSREGQGDTRFINALRARIEAAD